MRLSKTDEKELRKSTLRPGFPSSEETWFEWLGSARELARERGTFVFVNHVADHLAVDLAFLGPAILASDTILARRALATISRGMWIGDCKALRNPRRTSPFYTQIWSMLHAAAAGDRPCYERWFDLFDEPLVEGHRVPVTLFNTALALHRGEPDRAADLAAGLLSRKNAKGQEQLARSFLAIARRDPAALSVELEPLCATYRSSKDIHYGGPRKFLAVWSHAMVRLARWYGTADMAHAVEPPKNKYFWDELETVIAAAPDPSLVAEKTLRTELPDAWRLLHDLPDVASFRLADAPR